MLEISPINFAKFVSSKFYVFLVSWLVIINSSYTYNIANIFKLLQFS